MKPLIILLTLLASASSNPLALPSESKSPAVQPMPIINSQLTYIGPIKPGGENVTLHGTAQSVLAQIKSLNPSFHPDDFEVTRTARAKFEKTLAKRELELQQRSKQGVTNCGLYGNALLDANTIIPILSMPGACYVGGGPRTCVHLSCVNDGGNNAVSLCNDNKAAIAPTCAYLGTYAQDICGGKCAFSVDAGVFFPFIFCGGQEFDTDHYNVIVGTSLLDTSRRN
ncbi:hypothetical protein BDV96DRAFT_633958 [Lophiotrema nucula]|uniref:Uncharacterized protein n=1 Tax=Lophiotrema nucula TaxID=690887 RepID=A0A6A5YZZ6_9PLEO|nr:hypothetical protein BDV96DRAFT_633958 [Lophiotrema nucula]